MLKLGKLTRASVAYRGISHRTLPRQMREKDSESHTQGGIEYGFSSASMSLEEAVNYAKPGESTPIVFEIHQGLIDRGANFTWLSQYKHEREILFPPLMGLEILSHRVHENVLYVELRPSVNLNSLPIEKIIAKMRSSHLQLLDLLSDALRFEGVPSKMMQRLTSLKQLAQERDAMWFNSTRNYRHATEQALLQQTEIFYHLASPTNQHMLVDVEEATLYNVARLAAQAGEHKHAVDLLLLWHDMRNKASGRDRRLSRPGGNLSPGAVALRKATSFDYVDAGRQDCRTALMRTVEYLLEQGCPAPWPETVVKLMSKDTDGFQRKTETLMVDDIQRIVLKAIETRDDPFGVHARVLVKEGDDPATIWRTASITQIGDTEEATLQAGCHYKVHIGGGRYGTDLPQHKVVSTTEGGLGSLMLCAARLGEVTLVEALLKAGVSLFECDQHANTALIVASEEGQDGVCRVILEWNVPHEETMKGLRALRNLQRQNAYDVAVSRQKDAVLRVFQPSTSDKIFKILKKSEKTYHRMTLQQKVQGKARKWHCGVTTLMLACRENDTHLVHELINHHVDSSMRTEVDLKQDLEEPCTALTIAAEDGHIEITDALLASGVDADSGFLLEADHGKWRLPLLLAAQHGHVDVVEALINNDANVNAVRCERSVLMYACQFGKRECAERLLDASANIHFTGGRAGEETALDMASRYGHPETVRMLLDRHIHIVDCKWTALHRACANGHDEVAHLLLERHPLLIRQGPTTPLHAAAKSGFQKIVLMLLDHDADLEAVNDKQQGCVWLAAQRGQYATLKVLLSRVQHHPNRRSILEHVALPSGESQRGDHCPIDTRLHTTPLMVATVHGHCDAVRVLLHAKANPFRPSFSNDGHEVDLPRTALELAAYTGNRVLVQMLLSVHSRGLSHDKQEASERAIHFASSQSEVLHLLQTRHAAITPKGREQLAKQASHEGLKRGGSQFGTFKHDDFLLAEKLQQMTQSLTFNTKAAFSGQLVPPRPSEDEIAAQCTPLGPVVVHRGVTLQRGPHKGIFLRVGCVARHPWVDLWHMLRQLVMYYLSAEKKKYKNNKEEGGDPYKGPCIYVVVSLRAMQAIDFGWLVDKGFIFHHYREAGHGDTVPGDGNPEFVYKSWPGEGYDEDPVPGYATSIEGAFALLLSPDSTKVLLVWERRAWSCPGGSVNLGECKVDAACREVHEEVGVKVDLSKPIEYLGGYSRGRARDNLINDNFSAFALHAADETFQTDHKEIFHAAWFDVRDLIQQWQTKGRPEDKRVEGFEVPPEAQGNTTINISALMWADAYINGRGIRVQTKESMQNGEKAVHAVWGMRF